MSAHTNETMPRINPRLEIDWLRFELLEHEKSFWCKRYMNLVDRFENLVKSCEQYGYVEITVGNKTYKFTMEVKP